MLSHVAVILAALPAPGGFLDSDLVKSLGLPVLLVVAFYLMLFRPQQRRAKEHAARIGAIKRGDTVVMSNGMIGKVVRVEDTEVGVEIAQNVTVKVVKSMIAEVRARGEPAAANDAKA
ncbi:MAG TPA: preprotein translocase subunit YajC [Caulobacteraceae bacterium]